MSGIGDITKQLRQTAGRFGVRAAAKVSGVLVWEPGRVVVAHGERIAEAAWPGGAEPPAEATGGAIKGAVEQAGCKPAAPLDVYLNSPEILVRFFRLPMLPKAEWEQAVQFEARKYIPFKLDTLVWDYAARAVPGARATDAAGDEQLEVVLTAIPRQELDRIQAVLKAAGVTPARLEPYSQGLAQFASATAATPQSVECVVEVMPDRAQVVICRGGVAYLTRSVGLTGATAEAGGEAAPEDAAGRRLVSELHLLMEFFRREYGIGDIERIVLVGDEAATERSAGLITGQVSCRVVAVSALTLPEPIGRVPTDRRPARWLALHGASRGAVGAVNFLTRLAVGGTPGRPAAKATTALSLQAVLRQPRTVIATVATGVALSAALWGVGAMQVAQARGALAALEQAKRAQGAGPLNAMNDKQLKAFSKEAEEQLRYLRGIVKGRSSLAEKLDGLARALPDGIWLTGLIYEHKVDAKGKEGERILVHGACYRAGWGDELAAIQEFESKVKGLPQLSGKSASTQVGQIGSATDPRMNSLYRTFDLNYQASERL